MLDSLISRLAPHYCLSCGEIGAQICDNCFFDIELTPREVCILCDRMTVGMQCRRCDELAGVMQVVLTEREGVLKRLVDEYKFTCKRSAYVQVARCFDAGAPMFSESTYIVPLPTSSTHIRRRGFDHTRDFAKRFAELRGCNYIPLLARRHNKAQVGVGVLERKSRASTAFRSKGTLPDTDALYVVCDDIVTTGASVTAAVKCLRDMGAKKVAFLVLMKQV